MGFTTGTFPPVEPAEFLERPLMERMKVLALHWVDYGFGTPKLIPTTYVVKLVVLYLGLGSFLITSTSGLGPAWDVGSWWAEPIVYQKAIAWTMFLETLGLAGSWGPIAGKFKPMTGSVLFWARVGTIRMPPWPGKVPLTRGDARTPLDVALYLALLVTLFLPVVLPGVPSASLSSVFPENTSGLVAPALFVAPLVLLALVSLRDKTIAIASRIEQYAPALVIFSLVGVVGRNGFVDMIVALKVLIVSVWIGAGCSKFGRHFSNVVPPMVSNSPMVPTRWLRRLNYRDFPRDIRPSKAGGALAHIGGTTVEIVAPLTLLFSTNTTLTLAAVTLMVVFHLFITSTFPLAVPLEWNLLFAFGTITLFAGHPNQAGFAVWDMDPAWLLVPLIAGLVFFPILGNLRPDLVAFTPSMRQYAGNWASALWAFAPGCEDKLDAVVRPCRNQVHQLQALGYEPLVAEVTMQQTAAWRSMHSQGRGLFSLLLTHVPDVDRYTVREAEFAANSVIGFNFGDGHLHNADLIAALQRRCHFAPGELVVAWVESQPIHKGIQEYQVIDAALGVVERGWWSVKDAVDAQPWLPDGPIPLHPTWRRDPAEGVPAAEHPAAASAAPVPEGSRTLPA
ncbi:DUF3556 domain-containing protein [Actinomycetospora corticicola]|uniref:Putative membrane protein YkgB n=1 Tax=Actinomycetospora corticicola TaxID=663602 RepID=A0A7Y9E1Z9_9PSEU|nr:putative membrane protein YkgB [Actinomycetospora corticicola]